MPAVIYSSIKKIHFYSGIFHFKKFILMNVPPDLITTDEVIPGEIISKPNLNTKELMRALNS